MSVVIYIEVQDGSVKKTSLEAATMGVQLAAQMGVGAVGVATSKDDLEALSVTGLSEVRVLGVDQQNNPQVLATALAEFAQSIGAQVVLSSHSNLTEGMIPRLAIKLGATAVSNIIGQPDLSTGFKVKKSIYTSKAFANLELNTKVKVFTLKKGTFEVGTQSSTLNITEQPANAQPIGGYQILEVKKQEGDILLPEADLVVSAGRGLKGPENWGMIEELAKVLGAATACSKPVSDIDWRPHHEHVGQTGIKISPNLYIAVGISGAIQHLAGVSSSKVIVVINTDEDAPFFKAADYGIVGDAFEVVPKLVAALKN